MNFRFYAADCSKVSIPSAELSVELTGTSVKFNGPAATATALVPATGGISGSTAVKYCRNKGTAQEQCLTANFMVPTPGC